MGATSPQEGIQLVASGWLPARLCWDEGCSQAKKHRLLSAWLRETASAVPGTCLHVALPQEKEHGPRTGVGNP